MEFFSPKSFFLNVLFFFNFLFFLIHISLDTFSQNTFMGKLNQGQGHDGSVLDEESLNSIRGFFGSITGEYQCFEVCCPETSSCASKLL